MADQATDFLGSFMDDYYAESDEHVAAARQNLLLLEPAVDRAEGSPGVVEELFRSFHSLKGISAMVELREAEQLAHEMESCLAGIRDGRLALTSSIFEALVSGANLLEQVIAARRAGSPVPSIDAQVVRLAQAHRVARPGGTPSIAGAYPESARPTLRVTFTPSADLLARGVKVDTVRARLAQLGHIEDVAPRVMSGGAVAFDFVVSGISEGTLTELRRDGITFETLSTEGPAAGLSESAPVAPSRLSDATPALSHFVRVDLARLDDLMRLVGDLVVSRARLEDALTRAEPMVPAAEWRTLQEGSESLERQLRDLREGVMRVRLVSVSEIFRRMPFVVRDLARDGGKRVQVELAGQSTEIDKFLIERMMDPILHLVRNAISHGIESPEERVAADKRPEGTIRLSASTVGESVALEVSDDGRGMDLAAVASRARMAGLNVPSEAELDSRALLDLICAPGFSTRDEADRASGRGVGMTVVRNSVQELGGTLSVRTTAGTGTTFRVVLPLTLAITEALIVHVGDCTFAVPQAAVHEVVEVHPEALKAIENNELMVHRGLALPVVRLARLFAISVPPRSRMHALVIGSGLEAVGIIVDRISGQREIVVKTLRDPLVNVIGVSGATELGDGRLVLIVDALALAGGLRRPARFVRAAG